MCLGETSPRDAALTQPVPWALKVSSNLSQFGTFQSTKSLSQSPWLGKQMVLPVPLPLTGITKTQRKERVTVHGTSLTVTATALTLPATFA